MTRTCCTVLAAMVAVALVGCGSKAGPPANMDPVGTWEHKAPYHVDDAMANQEMTLKINSDSSFTLDVSGIESKGSWALVDNLLTLTYSEVSGMVPGDGNTAVLAISVSGTTFQTTGSGSTSVFDRVEN